MYRDSQVFRRMRCVGVVVLIYITGSLGLRFLTVIHDGVRLYNVIGGYEKLALLEDMVKDFDYHYSRNELYFITYRKLLRTTLLGRPKLQYEELFDPEEEYRFTSLAVDWVHNTLYWTSGPVLILHSASLDGTEPRVILRAGYVEKHLNKLVVDPYVGILFWMTNNEVHSCDLQGKKHRKNIFSDVSSIRNIALDTSRQRVYFIAAFEGGDKWFVASNDYDGTNLKHHATVPQITYGIGAQGKDVYWIPHEDDSCVWVGNDVYRHNFKLYTATTQEIEPSKVLLKFDEPIWNLRVCHAELQQPRNDSL